MALLLALANPGPQPVSAQMSSTLVISEVHPGGSGNGTYNADWFEVTNTGTTAVDIAGWRVDDNSNSSSAAVALSGVSSIAPGQSVVFIDASTPVDTNAFISAWFGSAAPAGLTIGTYGGSGIGLGTGGDAVNLFDAGGNRVTGISFGSAVPGATFDNTAGLGSTTLPLPLVTSASMAGVNGAFLSFNGAETGSPGRRISSAPQPSLDLSLFVRVGRFDLPEPTRTTAPPGSVLAQEVSAVTYNWDTDSLFVVGDGGTSVVQVTKTGQLIDSMTLAAGGSPQGTEFYDPEGLAYVGNGRFVLAEERDRQLVLFTYAAGTTLTRGSTQTVKLGTFVDNTGIEGLTYDPQTGGFILVKEIQPQGLFQTNVDFAAGTATNGSPTTTNSTNLFPLSEPFAGLLDFADIYALSNLSATGPEASHLLVLSQESGRIVHIDRNGQVFNSLTILNDPGNPLSVSAQQHEGLTMDGNGFLYVVSENGGGDFDHPQLWVYARSAVPNQAPTGIALNNQVNTLAENTSTAARVKVADVAIADDGIGTNNLTVGGADAGAFEVDLSGLFIKAGTNLDFETKSSYSVVVAVDDPTLGATPDATASYSLTLTDMSEETPLSSVAITEVSPWGSGNSPYGADWFEVTNIGATPVDLTGWRMDDSSADVASSVPMTGVTILAPGQSAIFLETSAGNPPGSVVPSFLSTWFGTTPPAGLPVGTYQGGGVGLSTGGDGVTLFNSAGVQQASVSFGASPATAPFASFDNAARLNGVTITALSAVGVNGAFTAAADASEIGSPGTIGPVGRLVITEVAPWSSGDSPFGADWFEVTNLGAAAVDITGWRVDDSSESPVASVPLLGVTSIAPGESVIFIETASPGSAAAAFLSTWFGLNTPEHLQIGSYSGGGIGLSTGGDAVVLYNTSGVIQAKVFFGVSPAGPTFATFDNAAGVNNAAVTQLSALGVHGAFAAANDPAEVGSPGTTAAHVIVSEVSPWSSGNTPYAADWFEVTNIGRTPVSIAGWTMDDNSNAFASAVPLRGVASILPGQSAIFLEGAADGSTDTTLLTNFATAWAGAPALPAGFLAGFYGGSGVGLGTGGDAVNLFDSLGNRITGVAFGGSTTGLTFDNAAGLGGTTLPLPDVTTLSIAGVNGAFVAADATETGSPGTIGTDAAADDDQDGFASAVEIASAGTPVGNVFGANPLNAASIPEVCDGVDNDLNEGIDEGFPDADGDGVSDCADGDDDGDGIADAVDPAPLSAANETFSDAPAPLNGSTSGRILTRAGKSLSIVDATPNPGTGVEVTVSGGGTASAELRLDGKVGLIALPSGVYVVTDPAATTTVAVGTGGPARITLTFNGHPVAIAVSGGASVTYTETTSGNGTLTGLRIDAVTGRVTLNDVAVTSPRTLVGPPKNADACKKNGWKTFNFPVSFKNQGDCVSYVQAASKAPKIDVPNAVLRVEASSPAGAVVRFTATASHPTDGALPVSCSPASGSRFPLGNTSVRCSATSRRGVTATESFRVWVRDTRAPDIISATPSVSVLPDTDRTVPVSIAVVVKDLVDPSPACRIVRVTGQGWDLDRDHVLDWRITGDLTLQIDANARRRRDRVYTITVVCIDNSWNFSAERTTVIVSHKK